jgi:hypothetical protein
VVVEQSTRDLEEIQFNPPLSSHCSMTDRAGRFKPAQQKLRSDDEAKFNHRDGKMRAERKRRRARERVVRSVLSVSPNQASRCHVTRGGGEERLALH